MAMAIFCYQQRLTLSVADVFAAFVNLKRSLFFTEMQYF